MNPRTMLSLVREARALAARCLVRLVATALPFVATAGAIASAGAGAIARSRADVRLALIAARSQRLRERRSRRVATPPPASSSAPPREPADGDAAEAIAQVLMLCAYARRGSLSARVLERMG